MVNQETSLSCIGAAQDEMVLALKETKGRYRWSKMYGLRTKNGHKILRYLCETYRFTKVLDFNGSCLLPHWFHQENTIDITFLLAVLSLRQDSLKI
jgi:hypothetical protein